MTCPFDPARDVKGMAISPSGKRVAIYFEMDWCVRVYTMRPPHNWIMSTGRSWPSIEKAIEDFAARGWSLTRDDE